MSFLIYVLSEVFSTYIICKGMRAVSGKRHTSVGMEIISYISLMIVICIVYYFWNIPILTVLTNLVMMYVVSFNYKGRILEHVLSVVIIYIILSMCDSFIILLTKQPYMEIFRKNDVSVDIHILILKYLLQFLFIIIFEKLYKKSEPSNISISLVQMLIFLSIMFGSVYLEMMLYAVLYEEQYETVIITDVVILVVNIAVIRIYDILRKQYVNEEKEHMLEMKNNAYENEFRLMKENNQSVNMLRHDMKNHFLTLKEYLSKGRMDAAYKYLQKLLERIDESRRWIDTGNPELDSFINYKFDLAQKYDINCSVQARIPESINIDVFSISCILGNLLDNAITAAKEVSNAEINVSLVYQKQNLYMTISNSYNGKLMYNKGKLITVKSDKSIHGYGIESVKREVEKCSGSISIEHDKKKFFVSIMLPIDDV